MKNIPKHLLRCIVLCVSCMFMYVTTALADAQPLAAEAAFQVQSQRVDPHTIVVNFKIAPGYYLYRDTIKISVEPPESAQLGLVTLPRGEFKKDEFLGDYYALSKNVQVKVPIKQDRADFRLQVAYQGCATEGFCYPPMLQSFAFKAMLIANAVSHDNSKLEKKNNTLEILKQSISNVQGGTFSFEQLFTQLGLPVLLLIFFCFGLLLAFTPCVLPTVPILAAIVIGQHGATAFRRSFLLCLVFISSMALTYAMAGWVAGTAGAYWQAELQKPWIVILSILFILAFAAYLFGVFNFGFLSRWQNLVHRLHIPSRQGTYIGAAILGLVSTLLVSPCVTPPLIGAIGFIAHQGNPGLGFVALLSLGLGMGTPLLIAGTFGAHYLQKLNGASVRVKNFFGWLLLILAVFLAARLLPEFLANLLLALYFFCAAIALKTFEVVSFAVPLNILWRRGAKKIIGIISFMLMLWFSVQAFSLWPNHHISANHKSSMTSSLDAKKQSFQEVVSLQALQPILQQAKEQQKQVLLDFYADWCIACQRLEHHVFVEPRVQDFLKKVVWVRVNVTQNNENSKALLKHYKVIAPPTLIYFSAAGDEITSARMVGEVSADRFLEVSRSVL